MLDQPNLMLARTMLDRDPITSGKYHHYYCRCFQSARTSQIQFSFRCLAMCDIFYRRLSSSMSGERRHFPECEHRNTKNDALARISALCVCVCVGIIISRTDWIHIIQHTASGKFRLAFTLNLNLSLAPHSGDFFFLSFGFESIAENLSLATVAVAVSFHALKLIIVRLRHKAHTLHKHDKVNMDTMASRTWTARQTRTARIAEHWRRTESEKNTHSKAPTEFEQH